MKYSALFIIGLMLLAFSGGTQSICDSVKIHATTFDPLNSETKVQVLVENGSSWFFDYPKFILRDAQDDTVASETVNFFGLGHYLQTHTLDLNANFESTSLSGGKLQLYGINDTLVCEWQDDYDLCVDSCVDLVVIMQGVNFPSAAHRYTYSIIDSNNTVLLSDTLRVDSANYTDRDSICLPQGNYKVEFIHDFSSSTEDVHVRVDPYYNTSGPLAKGEGDLSFDMGVFSACLDTNVTEPNGLPSASKSKIVIHWFNADLYISGIESAKAQVDLYDMRGRVVKTDLVSGPLSKIYLGNVSSGMYLVRVKDGEQIGQQKVFID